MSAISKTCGAAAALVAGACVGVAGVNQGPDRYLVCDPVKGSQNLTFEQASKAVALGDAWAADFVGIGLSCDNPPAGYKDTGVKVGPAEIPDAGNPAANVYEQFKA